MNGIEKEIEFLRANIKSPPLMLGIKIFSRFGDNYGIGTSIEMYIHDCKRSLNSIKSTLGSNNETYIELSSNVAQIAIDRLEEKINISQKGSSLSGIYENIIYVYDDSIEILNEIAEMDMYSSTRERVDIKKIMIVNSLNRAKELIEKQKRLNQRLVHHKPQNSPKNQSTGGCYIATMAYGSYGHPQVLELRKFRDNTLTKYAFGRGFIKAYYKYSPGLVTHLNSKPLVNKIIRSILNTIIRFVN